MVFKDILLVILGQLSSVTVFRLLFLPVSSVLVLWVLIWLSVLCLESLFLMIMKRWTEPTFWEYIYELDPDPEGAEWKERSMIFSHMHAVPAPDQQVSAVTHFTNMRTISNCLFHYLSMTWWKLHQLEKLIRNKRRAERCSDIRTN